MPKRARIVQLGVKTEATHGVAATIAAADVLVRVRSGFERQQGEQHFDLDELRESFSAQVNPHMESTQGFGFSWALRGAGDLTTAPAILPILDAALLADGAAKSISCGGGGAVATAAMPAGETITGAPSGGTGRLYRRGDVGDTSLVYVPISGALASGDAITCSNSSGTATSDGAPADSGYGVRPVTWSDGAGQHATIKAFTGSSTASQAILTTARGCLGDLSLDMSANEPCIATMSAIGALESRGTGSTLAVSAYPEAAQKPGRFRASGIEVDGDTGFSPSLQSAQIVRAVQPALVADATTTRTDGVLYADASPAPIEVTLTFDEHNTTDFDWTDKIRNDTTVSLEWQVGATSGAIHVFSFPKAQVMEVTPSEREPGAALYTVRFRATGDTDNEFLWLMI